MDKIDKTGLSVWFIICLFIIVLSDDYKYVRYAIASALCALAFLANLW